ncbi:mycothiol synthase [Rathayibacter sp. CAU 1779]
MPPGSSAPRLTVRTVAADALQDVLAIADAAHIADGVDPFNEQTRLDLPSGRRVAYAGALDGIVVAAAATGEGELDLVVAPEQRGYGYGTAMLESLLPSLDGDVSAWSHGDHPAAGALAASHGFERVRTLLRLVLPRLDDVAGVTDGPAATGGSAGTDASAVGAPDGIRVSEFDHDTDAADWLALNARAFAAHPEQGSMTAGDLAEREAEPWFDARDFLIARDAAGRMVGFHWMKREPGSPEGEVYVLGVDPETAGKGLGRFLLLHGLLLMRERGVVRASLYVEGDNDRALGLYRRTGFVDDTIDVQYRRLRVG